MFLYLAVNKNKIIIFIIVEVDVNITNVRKVLNLLPIIKKDGNRKKIRIYHTGVSMKKFVFITFASIVAASMAAKNKPVANMNNRIFPINLEDPLVKIHSMSYTFLESITYIKYIAKSRKIKKANIE